MHFQLTYHLRVHKIATWDPCSYEIPRGYIHRDEGTQFHIRSSTEDWPHIIICIWYYVTSWFSSIPTAANHVSIHLTHSLIVVCVGLTVTVNIFCNIRDIPQ